MTEVHLFVQARTGSTRLPRKVLMPIAGRLSLLETCVRRLRSPDWNTAVLTSTGPDDDAIATVAQGLGARAVRGSEEDVLSRFLLAAQDLPDSDLIVRATADNPFPDDDFVRSAIEAFCRCSADYADFASPSLTGLPYGLAAEVFTVKALRGVGSTTLTAEDREHVTTALRRSMSDRSAVESLRRELDAPAAWQKLRCTVDTVDDLRTTRAVFRDSRCDWNSNWRQLCSTLNELGREHSFVLGGAQLGHSGYGRTHSGSPVDTDAVVAALSTASHLWLDTAQAYPGSEQRVGQALENFQGRPHVTTKLDPQFVASSGRSLVTQLTASLRASKERLRVPIETLMLHRYAQAEIDGLIEGLASLRQGGYVDRIGLSAVHPHEVEDALASELSIDDFQIPFNIADRRWDDVLRSLHQSADTRVVARSVYLQGLLVEENGRRFPARVRDSGAALVADLGELSRDSGLSRPALALRFPLTFPDIDQIVVGCQSPAEVTENLALAASGSLDRPCAQALFAIGSDSFKRTPGLADPSMWSQLE